MKTEVKATPNVSVSIYSPYLLALRLIYSFEDLYASALLKLDKINFIADISSCSLGHFYPIKCSLESVGPSII